MLDKYEILGDRLAEALTARPHDEPIWVSLRRAFDIVVEYFADDPDATRTLAMERIIQGNPALTAGQLERVGTQDQLLDVVRDRTGRHDPTDPRPAAIISAALSCLIAAKSTWVDSSPPAPAAHSEERAQPERPADRVVHLLVHAAALAGERR